jgi:hypothetical protein
MKVKTGMEIVDASEFDSGEIPSFDDILPEKNRESVFVSAEDDVDVDRTWVKMKLCPFAAHSKCSDNSWTNAFCWSFLGCKQTLKYCMQHATQSPLHALPANDAYNILLEKYAEEGGLSWEIKTEVPKEREEYREETLKDCAKKSATAAKAAAKVEASANALTLVQMILPATLDHMRTINPPSCNKPSSKAWHMPCEACHRCPQAAVLRLIGQVLALVRSKTWRAAVLP